MREGSPFAIYAHPKVLAILKSNSIFNVLSERHVARVPIGVGRLALRGLLIAVVVPPFFVDSDGRGLHDRVTGTAVVRR